MRARRVLSIAALAVATSGLAACGTHQEGGTATPPKTTQSSTPSQSTSAGSGKPVVVNLPGSSKTVQLVVGQQLTVHFKTGVAVEPSTTKCSATATSNVVQRLCGGAADNLTYKAVHAGTSSMLFTIKPKCSSGAVCPDWVQQAHFSVVVKS